MPNVPLDDDRPPRHDIPHGGRSGFVEIDGRQLHYLEWGHAGRPATVCLHGGGQTAYMYEDLGAALAGDRHVLAYDFPDHGDSDPFDDSLHPERVKPELAGSVVGMCAEFGIRRAVVVGASMGGIVAVHVADTHPDLVAGVVLLDVGPRLEPEGVARILTFMSEPESFADLDEAAAAIAAYLPQRTITPRRLTRNLRQRADGRWVWKHEMGRRIRRQGIPDMTRTRPMVAGMDDELRRLSCPVLVLRGAQSDILSEDGARELLDLIPDARYARIAAAGHLAAGDNPESFVGLVKGFCAEIGA